MVKFAAGVACSYLSVLLRCLASQNSGSYCLINEKKLTMALNNFCITQFVYKNSGEQGELYSKVLGDVQIAPSEELGAWGLPELCPRAAQCAAYSHSCLFLCPFSSTRAASNPIYTCFPEQCPLQTQGSWCIQICEMSCISCFFERKCPI